VVARNFFKEVPNVKSRLEELGHQVIPPVLYGNLIADEMAYAAGQDKYAEFRRKVIAGSDKAIKSADAVLCLNFDKGGTANYISSDMFTELLQAFEYKKKIYLWSYIPDGVLRESILAFKPIVIKRKVSTIGLAEGFKPKKPSVTLDTKNTASKKISLPKPKKEKPVKPKPAPKPKKEKPIKPKKEKPTKSKKK
jgi:hypothetical protein